MIKKTSIYTKRLSDAERATLLDAVSGIIYPAGNYRKYLEEIVAARCQVSGFFSDLIARDDLSRSYPHYVGAIKIENLPLDANPPMPPTQGGSLKWIEKPSYISENVLVLVASLFGHPYSMFCEGRGLVNNLVPTRTTSTELTGLGAASDLRFHIENAALRFLTGYDCSPKALFLTGVRQDVTPPFTRLSDARPALALLGPEDRKALATASYRLRLPYRWRGFRDGYDELITARVPLIRSTPDGLLVNAVLYGDMIADCGTAAGGRAVRNFEAALEEVALDEVVRPGELLCIDNRVTLHARTPFKASFDDEGRAYRWAQRVFVTERLENFRRWNEVDDNVFAPTFAGAQRDLQQVG